MLHLNRGSLPGTSSATLGPLQPEGNRSPEHVQSFQNRLIAGGSAARVAKFRSHED